MWLVHENTYVSPLCKNGSTYVYSLNREVVSLSGSSGKEKEEKKKNKELGWITLRCSSLFRAKAFNMLPEVEAQLKSETGRPCAFACNSNS